MVRGILGKKVGMTQIFDDDGRVVPVTVVEAGPCVVVQIKNAEKDGYEAVQIGLVERSPRRNASKPIVGHFKDAGVPPTRMLGEVPLDGECKPGDSVLADIFSVDEEVNVTAKSKGRGFQGVMKRHGHAGGQASHGSGWHRKPGSIGQSAWPSKVFKGVKMPGQMGNKRITVKNVKVVKVDLDRNLLFLKGGVPGARNSYIRIVKVQG
ncbi:MAG: 50S ribosomal protein L3 [Acidobacteria bacterium]|nr:MAG: 50S ribosomal protein L3 [Acidobacteriota bacterium]RLE32236.1 MAG: 50S ribosomal protein L3 [Acidobacteriota bacterium]